MFWKTNLGILDKRKGIMFNQEMPLLQDSFLILGYGAPMKTIIMSKYMNKGLYRNMDRIHADLNQDKGTKF
jgi:hypothetical protein